jgi:hypothetical protein
MIELTAKEVVEAFWNAMRTNEFELAASWLSEDFEGYWPQSNELTLGRENFISINTAYPAKGKWTFHQNSIVAENNRVVTDVSISDGTLKVRAITFHTVKAGKICHQIEFWPDEYPAPEWRRQWVSIPKDGYEHSV